MERASAREREGERESARARVCASNVGWAFGARAVMHAWRARLRERETDREREADRYA